MSLEQFSRAEIQMNRENAGVFGPLLSRLRFDLQLPTFGEWVPPKRIVLAFTSFISLPWPRRNPDKDLDFSGSKPAYKWMTCHFQASYEIGLEQVTHRNCDDFEKEHRFEFESLFLAEFLIHFPKWNLWISVFLIQLRLFFIFFNLLFFSLQFFFFRLLQSCFICILIVNLLWCQI